MEDTFFFFFLEDTFFSLGLPQIRPQDNKITAPMLFGKWSCNLKWNLAVHLSEVNEEARLVEVSFISDTGNGGGSLWNSYPKTDSLTPTLTLTSGQELL